MRIKELGSRVGVSPDTIKRWERAGLVPQPSRDPKGWRLYGEHDVARLQRVLKSLHGTSKHKAA